VGEIMTIFRVRGTSLSALLCVAPLVAYGQDSPADPVSAISKLVENSSCAATKWGGQSRAPLSYIAGVSLVFARSVCHPERAEVVAASHAVDPAKVASDGLAAYASQFKNLGMSNDASGVVTLRHTYLLLLGLGIRESSGKYCEGRDVSECFDNADSAEAGLFQTSYGIRNIDPSLTPLIGKYAADNGGCMLESFADHLTCAIRKSHNPKCPDATSDIAGTGPGADWQKLTKSCPAFATEYAAVVLRKHGGTKGEFGPIRRSQAQVIPACDALFSEIQTYIERNPAACSTVPLN
jgi:hypothetical protein